MSEEIKKNSSLWGKVSKLLFNEDYLQQQGTAPAIPATNTPVPAAPVPSISVHNTASTDMVERVKALLTNNNKPGIDFLELWDAAEAMGAVNDTTVTNAFTALKIASGNTLSKQAITDSGRQYIQELQQAINSDVANKQAQKNKLVQDQEQQLQLLQTSVQSITKQIQDLQVTLQQQQTQLQQLQQGNNPEVAIIDQKITQGQAAVQAVVAEIETVLALVQKNINN